MQEELVTLPSVSQSDLRRGMPENLVKRGVKFGRFCAAFEGDLDASSDHVSVMYLLREGACTNDVCKIFEFFDPLPPVTVTLTQLISTVVCFGGPSPADVLKVSPPSKNLEQKKSLCMFC